MLTGNTLLCLMLTPRYNCSWAEFQTMIVPQPGPGSWASPPALPQAISLHPSSLSGKGPFNSTLQLNGLDHLVGLRGP